MKLKKTVAFDLFCCSNQHLNQQVYNLNEMSTLCFKFHRSTIWTTSVTGTASASEQCIANILKKKHRGRGLCQRGCESGRVNWCIYISIWRIVFVVLQCAAHSVHLYNHVRNEQQNSSRKSTKNTFIRIELPAIEWNSY